MKLKYDIVSTGIGMMETHLGMITTPDGQRFVYNFEFPEMSDKEYKEQVCFDFRNESIDGKYPAKGVDHLFSDVDEQYMKIVKRRGGRE
jgi:hypothetical protein